MNCNFFELISIYDWYFFRNSVWFYPRIPRYSVEFRRILRTEIRGIQQNNTEVNTNSEKIPTSTEFQKSTSIGTPTAPWAGF